MEEVQAAVRAAINENLGVRVAGSGHSFTRLVATDEVIIDPRGIDQIEAVEAATARATLGAGARICDLGAPLEARGLSLLNQGDIHAQAISGAVSRNPRNGARPRLVVVGSDRSDDRDRRGTGAGVTHRESEIFHHARVGLGRSG